MPKLLQTQQLRVRASVVVEPVPRSDRTVVQHQLLEVNLFCLAYAQQDLYDQLSLHTSRLPMNADRRQRVPRHKQCMRGFSDRIPRVLEKIFVR